MRDVQVGEEDEMETPPSATSLVITHEWGDHETFVVAQPSFTWTPDSIGSYKLAWFNGINQVSVEFVNSFVPLITQAQFAADYPSVSIDSNQFRVVEQISRLIIQNYTGQKFGPYTNKSLRIQGDGGDALVLPVRCVSLTSVANNYGDDISELVEPYTNDSMIVHRASRFAGGYYEDVKRDVMWNRHQMFSEKYVYTINGTFGFEFVPQEVSIAARTLIFDGLGGSDVADLRAHGVFEAQIGDFKLRLNADQWGTTGSTVADNLLAPYVILGIGLV